MIRLFLFILCSMVATFCKANDKPTLTPADTTIDVQLGTNGGVEFTGAATDVSAKAVKKTNAQNPADTLFKRVEDTDKNVKIVTSQANAGQSHGNTQVSVPQKYNLKFQTATGDVKLSDIDARVRGVVKNGSISATRVKGRIDVFTAKGNINVSDSDADGLTMTKSGNITLTDVRSRLSPNSQNGKVNVKTTSSYFGIQKATAMNLTYDQADLDIATVPEGGSFVIDKGNITVASAAKNVELRSNEGNLTLSIASGGARLMTKKGKAVVKVALNSTSTEPIQIETQDGDAELWIPRQFAGNFVIVIDQNKNLNAPNRLLTDVAFTNINTQQLKHPTTQEVVGIQVNINQKIGKTNLRIVRIRAVNGNVYVRYW
jgi:hypothetical protein